MFNPNEAPDGYLAVDDGEYSKCILCSFIEDEKMCSNTSCASFSRKDSTSVHFVKKENNVVEQDWVIRRNKCNYTEHPSFSSYSAALCWLTNNTGKFDNNEVVAVIHFLSNTCKFVRMETTIVVKEIIND